MIRIDVIWVGADIIKINVILNLKTFVLNFCNFKFILMPRVFEIDVAYRIFSFNYCCTMSRRASVGKILCSPDGAEEGKATLPGHLWANASNSSWWMHTNSVITILQDYPFSHFSTTSQTSKGDVLIIVSLYVNGNACLVGVNDDWVNHRILQMRSPKRLQAASYLELCKDFSYNWQQYYLHPRAVGVRQLVCHQSLRGIFTKRNIQLWCWW